MSMKLLPASVNPVDSSQPPDGPTSLVPMTQSAIATRASQHSYVPSSDAFAWSSSTRASEPSWIDGTPVQDSPNDETNSGGEYVSGRAWSRPVESTAIAQYLFYAAGLAGRSVRILDVYA